MRVNSTLRDRLNECERGLFRFRCQRVLHQIRVQRNFLRQGDRPRPCVHPGIVDRNFEVHGSVVQSGGSSPSPSPHSSAAVPRGIRPPLVPESRRGHNQRIADPLTRGVAVEGGTDRRVRRAHRSGFAETRCVLPNRITSRPGDWTNRFGRIFVRRCRMPAGSHLPAGLSARRLVWRDCHSVRAHAW